MKVKMLKACVAGGDRRALGDIVDVSEDVAHFLIVTGRAEEYVAPKPKPKKAASKS